MSHSEKSSLETENTKHCFKKIWIPFLVLFLILAIVFFGMNQKSSDDFEHWNKSSVALTKLCDYVNEVTNKSSANYIPKKDRIAIFDMDGTLYGEKAPTYVECWLLKYRVFDDPLYEAPDDIKQTANKIVLAAQTGIFPEELEKEHTLAVARAFAGMSLEEYKEYVEAFISKKTDGFEGLTYAKAWYLPMIEVVDYLNENGFSIYVCSGTDRFLCRILADGVIDIPKENFIGTDVQLEASGQNETDGLEYAYTSQDYVVRTDKLIIKNIKANKVAQIAQEIGRQPVLAFGNSSGDESMAMYVTSNNPYYSAAFMLVADDEEREYGDIEKAKTLKEKWESLGWNTISMHNDFLTIYGYDVKLEPLEY